MKTFIFAMIFLLVSPTIMAQRSNRGPAAQRMHRILFDPTHDDEIIAYYLVVERINMNFGSREISYRVPHLSMISTASLGPNNSRTITPKYVKAKPRRPQQSVSAMATAPVTATNAGKLEVSSVRIPIPTATMPTSKPEVDPMVVKIDLLRTYERVLDKGYKSVDMLKKVANGRFFEGDLPVAAKYYKTLFELTQDLEPVYYYRYAQALNSINEKGKAKEMMTIFEERNR